MLGRDSERPLPPSKLFVIALCTVLGFVGLTSLGVWQLERRVWKLALIERVTQRVHAASVAAPGPREWSSIKDPEAKYQAEYRHVVVTGHLLNDRETLVKAVTDAGSGYWVLTPLQADDGFVVLINRGFVPAEKRGPASRAAGQVNHAATVTGLLRLSEPNGAFLRSNDPQANRWYSRDVTAIATAHSLELANTAPYFIDADAYSENNTSDSPVGGLTVINFPNNHLSYAITWFVLALMPAAFLLFTIRRERRLRRSK